MVVRAEAGATALGPLVDEMKRAGIVAAVPDCEVEIVAVQVQASLSVAILYAGRIVEEGPVRACSRHRVTPTVLVPDVRARLDALQIWLNESLGKIAQVAGPSTPTLPTDPEKIDELSWSAMRSLAAIHDHDLVRREIASLSEDQKRDLREAFTEGA